MAARIVRNNTSQVIAALRQLAIARIDSGAEVIEAVSRQIVPVDTGALKGSMERTGEGTATQTVRYGDSHKGGEVDYALLVEADQPFLRPAAEQGAEAIRRRD